MADNIVLGSGNSLCEGRPQKVLQIEEVDWARLEDDVNDISPSSPKYSNTYCGAFAFSGSTVLPIIEFFTRDGNKPLWYIIILFALLVFSVVIGFIFYRLEKDNKAIETSGKAKVIKELSRLKDKNQLGDRG